jgi:hypothetical protein
MKKSRILVLLLFSIFQMFFIDQLYTQEDENIWYNRERYFFIQRGSPYDSTPTDGLQNALQEKVTMGPGGYYLQGTNWNNIGPAPVYRGDDYFPGNDEYCSGRVNSVKYLNSSTIYIGAAAGGVWKTNTYSINGADWQNMSSGLKSLTTGALAVDNSDPNNPVIYYATGEGNYGFMYSYLGLGIFKSTNGGLNWIQIYTGSGLPTKNVRYFKLVIRPGFNNQIFAASNMGLFRSIDAGNTWSVVQGTENLQCNDVIFSNSNSLLAYVVGPNLTSGGVEYKRSFDGGNSFNVQQGSGLNIAGRTHLVVCRDDNQILYLATDLGKTSASTWEIRVYQSVNGGNTFTQKYNVCTDTYGGYALCLAVKPNDANKIYIGAAGLFMSSNGGTDFCSIAGPTCEENVARCNPINGTDYMHFDYHSIDFNPSNPEEMVIATDGGPYLSTDGGIEWESLNIDNDFSITQLYRISSNIISTIGGIQDEGLYSKSVNSLMWTAISGAGDGTGVLNSKLSTNTWFGFIGNTGQLIKNGLAVSHNFGNGWDGGNDWIGAFTDHPMNEGTFFTARRQNTTNQGTSINFWKTEDYGADWGEQPFSTISSNISPQNIVVSSRDPQTVYLSTSGYTGPLNSQVFGREIYKSTNGGGIWIAKVSNTDNNIPNRYISRMLTVPSDNPNLEDEIYITLSSFNLPGNQTGHVFKSTNGGSNWDNITGNLPNIPVNDIVVWNESKTQKNLVVATDIGVFISANNGITWRELAANLPNTIIMDLEYIVFENKLRVATFGRGVWDIDLPGDVYIKGTYATAPPDNLIKDIYVCNDSKLIFKGNGSYFTNIANSKKISIEDGGTFEANLVTFYGQNWGGVIFNGNSQGLINNCEFIENSNSSIRILGSEGIDSYNNITINYTSFSYTGNIYIESRENVLVSNCIWTRPDINVPDVWGIQCVGSNDVTIFKNRFNDLESGSQNLNSTAISVIYGNNTVISQNRIFDSRDGIQISNSSVTILDNYISHEFEPGSAENGITLDNSYSSVIKNNNIIDYSTGIFLYNSSPDMYSNVIGNNNTPSTALYAGYGSSPRLRPQESIGETIWDAGKNELEALYTGNGNKYAISITNYSIPNIDMGCNTINGNSYNIAGDIGLCAFLLYNYPATLNNWNNPNNNNVCDATIETSPDGCLTGGGGSFSNEENTPPPQPIIINYGNGILDTIQISNRSIQLSADKSIYHSACKDELLNDHQTAIAKYKQIIQNYQDSSTAINSLRRILHCNDKLNVDTNSYSDLRIYYQALILSNLTDTAFVNVAEELAAKCLVRMGHPTNAINEYEVIISNTNDSAKILCAELNIIETYLIIQNSGDSPNYTGQLGYLKPNGKEDAYKKIMDRLHKSKNKKPVNQLPKEYQLSQNYPNPFNPATKIKYALPYGSNVTLKVYDILGREVISLVNEFKDAGSYIVEFNGKNYASGVYFYRIEAEGQNGRKYVERKKMVLVK